MWQLLALSLAGCIVSLGVIASIAELIARYRARRLPVERTRDSEPWE